MPNWLRFLGIVLAAEREKVPTDVKQISFLTQKLLLSILYQKRRTGTAAELAALLGVSRMSGVRCLDELETLLPSLIQQRGRNRRLIWDGTWWDFWSIIHPILRNPVVREYRLESAQLPALPLGGMSAVCHYSMLDDNPYRTYAVVKAAAAELKLATLPQVPKNEVPGAVVQVIGYEIQYREGTGPVVDPLTAVLSIGSEDQDDPRVESAIQQIEEAAIAYEGV